jgi:membrane protein required for colicin V production
MNITDYLVIAAILISAAVGSVRGFLREAIALVTWVIALFLAARVIIVVVLLLLGTGIGVAVAHFVRLSIFSGMDRFLGFLFGAFRGFVLLGVFVILGQLLRLDGEHWWRKSVLMPYGESIANGLRAVVGDHGERRASSDRGLTFKGG